MEMLQRVVARFVTSNYDRDDCVIAMLKELKWPTLLERRFVSMMAITYKAINEQAALDNPAFVAMSTLWQTWNPISIHISHKQYGAGTYCQSKVEATS